MAQSPEYPDLKWVPPRSWSSGRAAGQPTVIVIHTTEGSEHALSAEDGAAYDARRTDGTSTHYFHDENSTIQCVRTTDRAHTARANGNRIGIHHELCGRAGQGVTGWADASSQGELRQAAKQAARDARKWDIPVRHLTRAQLADGQKGFCGHVDITYAFPQDDGTHTDPGPNFPWTQFLNMVREEMEDDTVALSDTEVDKVCDEMDRRMTARFGAKLEKIAKAVGDLPVDIETDKPGTDLQPWSNVDAYGRDERHRIITSVNDVQRRAGALEEKMTNLDGKMDRILNLLEPAPDTPAPNQP